jgi:hypothetical protein
MSTDQRLKNPKDNFIHHQRTFHTKSWIGYLMYLAVCTRPDIANVIRILNQFNSCYSLDQWHATKPVFKYLELTINYTLFHSKSDTFLEHHDFVSNLNDTKSISGFVLKLANCHFVTEMFLEGMIVLKFLNTSGMLGDILTKLLKENSIFVHRMLVLRNHNKYN